jgi:TonB family protein
MMYGMVLVAAVAAVAGAQPQATSVDQAQGVRTADDVMQAHAARNRLPRSGLASGVRPRNSPGEWIRPDDYPPAALRASASGMTRFRLDIGTNGQVVRCTVTQSSGNGDLDTTACAMLTKRAGFVPARDRKGRAVASTYSSSVNWQIPADAPSSPCVIATPLPGDIAVTGLPVCP